MATELDEFIELAISIGRQEINPRLIGLIIEFEKLWVSRREREAIETIEFLANDLGFGFPLVRAIGECFNLDANNDFDIKVFLDRYAPRGTRDEFVKLSKLYFAVRTSDKRFHIWTRDVIDEYNSKVRNPAKIVDFWLRVLKSEVATKLLNISRVVRLNYATIYVVFKNNNHLELCADRYLYKLADVKYFHLLEYPKLVEDENDFVFIEFAKGCVMGVEKFEELDVLGIYSQSSGYHPTSEKGHLSIAEKLGDFDCFICGVNDKCGCSYGEWTDEFTEFYDLIVKTICNFSNINNFRYSTEYWLKPKKYKLVDGFFKRLKLTYELMPEIENFRSWLYEIIAKRHKPKIEFDLEAREFTVEIENSIFPYYEGIYDDCLDFEIPQEFKFINSLSVSENGNLEIRTRAEKSKFRELIAGGKAGKFFKNALSISNDNWKLSILNSSESSGNIELVPSPERLREFKEFMRNHNKLDIPDGIYSGCYLLQTNGDRGSNKYKIGKASNLMKRLKTCEGYKNALVIQAEFVRDSDACEREIIEVFTNEFERVKFDLKGNYGSEYFRGEYAKIRRRFQEICEKYW